MLSNLTAWTVAEPCVENDFIIALLGVIGSSSEDDLRACSAPSVPKISLYKDKAQFTLSTGPEPIVLRIVPESPITESA